jgi:hypothetical protein
MPLAEFKATVPASQQMQTHALDSTAFGIDLRKFSGKDMEKLPNKLNRVSQ